MSKLVCMFAGWFEINTNDVRLIEPETQIGKTAAVWLKERGNIDGLILESFNDTNADSNDGEFEQLDLSIEDEQQRRDEKNGLYLEHLDECN